MVQITQPQTENLNKVTNRNIWVADIETLKSCFTYTALNIDTLEQVQYVIHKERNDILDLMHHLTLVKGMIGYNIINFDYPVLHYMMQQFVDEWEDLILLSIFHPDEICKLIHKRAQDIIEAQNARNFNSIVAVKRSDWAFALLDLFKIWHFNNPAKATSLKALEIAMQLPDVMDMPIDHEREDIKAEEIDDILIYNANDVFATYQFYLKSKEKIDLRKDIIKLYDIPCLNFNDVKIGESIFLKLLAKDMGINQWDLNKLRTHRESINFTDIILPYITFNSKPFKDLLYDFKSTVVTKTKDGFKKQVTIKDGILDYGQGGLHMCIKPGVYESNEEYMIYDIDVSSFYPNIAVNNNFRPEHLGDSFSKIYSNIYHERSKIPKTDPRNGAYKLMLNGCFGKAGDINSFLYDKKFLLSITVNGQLLLTLLLDKFIHIKDLQVLQCNTDGITLRFKRKDYLMIKNICSAWEDLTKLKLEYVEYNKMVIRDVNNYMAQTTANKIKYKGAFEIDKDYHKDHSFKIIPIALSKYFFEDIPIEETLKDHDNIYDFCGRQKFGKDSYGTLITLIGNQSEVKNTGKNIRYYVTTKGSTLLKVYTKGTNEYIHKGYQVKDFNKYVKKDIKDYKIDYTFYKKECMKEIDIILPKQLELNYE